LCTHVGPCSIVCLVWSLLVARHKRVRCGRDRRHVRIFDSFDLERAPKMFGFVVRSVSSVHRLASVAGRVPSQFLSQYYVPRAVLRLFSDCIDEAPLCTRWRKGRMNCVARFFELIVQYLQRLSCPYVVIVSCTLFPAKCPIPLRAILSCSFAVD